MIMKSTWKRALACAVASLSIAAISSPVHAHGVVGQRFFPATISTDDPFAADELALPTITSFDDETDFDFDYSKTIFHGFAIEVGTGHIDARSPGEPREKGWGNLEVSPTLELYRNTEHEFIFTTSVGWEIGGTGSKAVAEQHSTYTPTIKFGKGFGDLPESLKYLRPLALTGTVGYAIPGAHDEPKTIEWGGALEYSLLYLQNNVRDEGFTNLVAHLTPVVEFSFSSPTRSGKGGTTGTINPGLIWSGQHIQLAAEAIVPVNHASGDGVGFIGQLHFYIDDLFPHSLGRPIFGGTK